MTSDFMTSGFDDLQIWTLDLSDALVGTYPQDPQTGGLALSPFWTCPEYAPLVALWGIHRQCASGDMPYMISQDLRPSESWIPGTRSLDLMSQISDLMIWISDSDHPI